MATPTYIFTTICVTLLTFTQYKAGATAEAVAPVHGSGKKHKYAISAYYSTEFNYFSQTKKSVIYSPALYNGKCTLNFVC